MNPIPVGAKVIQAGDFLVADLTYEPQRHSHAHEHELPFVGIVLAGVIEKHLGPLSFSVPTAGAYAMPAGVRHVDGFPLGARLLTLELDLSTELWERCDGLVSRVRRLRGPQIATIARQLAVELRMEDDLRTIALEGLSLELVAAATRSVKVTRPKAPGWLNTVDEFLVENFFRSLRIAEVAAIVHVHPAHLARVFRAHHGETIGYRIRRLRLDWAIGELLEGERPLRDIATQAGFAHQSHFSRAFKEYTGWPPAQYRERQRANAA